MTQRMESYNKGLAREMKSCSHTLAILFEYAWSKARRSLEAGKSMARVWIGGSELRSFRYVAYLLLLMVVGVGEMWGQGTPAGNDLSGIFYFANCGSGKTGPDDPRIANITDPDNYFYLIPADNPQQSNKRDAYYSDGDTDGDSNKPYLTTYRTKG